MIIDMCTAPAMMPAPTMKVMPEKTKGACMQHTDSYIDIFTSRQRPLSVQTSSRSNKRDSERMQAVMLDVQRMAMEPEASWQVSMQEMAIGC